MHVGENVSSPASEEAPDQRAGWGLGGLLAGLPKVPGPPSPPPAAVRLTAAAPPPAEPHHRGAQQDAGAHHAEV